MSRSKTLMHEDAERRMRELVRNGGLDQPDEVSYEFDPDEVVLFWREPKLAVVVELDERDDGEADTERLALGRDTPEPADISARAADGDQAQIA